MMQFSAQVASVRFSLVIIITSMLLTEHVIACGWFGLGSIEAANGIRWVSRGQSKSWDRLRETERERERDILDALKWKQRESADKPIQTSAVSGHPFLRQSDKVGNSRYPLSEIIKYDWQ